MPGPAEREARRRNLTSAPRSRSSRLLAMCVPNHDDRSMTTRLWLAGVCQRPLMPPVALISRLVQPSRSSSETTTPLRLRRTASSPRHWFVASAACEQGSTWGLRLCRFRVFGHHRRRVNPLQSCGFGRLGRPRAAADQPSLMMRHLALAKIIAAHACLCSAAATVELPSSSSGSSRPRSRAPGRPRLIRSVCGATRSRQAHERSRAIAPSGSTETAVSPPWGEPDESPAHRVNRKSPVSRAFSVAGL